MRPSTSANSDELPLSPSSDLYSLLDDRLDTSIALLEMILVLLLVSCKLEIVFSRFGRFLLSSTSLDVITDFTSLLPKKDVIESSQLLSVPVFALDAKPTDSSIFLPCSAILSLACAMTNC